MNLSTPEKAMMNGVASGAAQPSGRAIYEQRKQYGRTSANEGEISQYYVEHLLTLPVERKDGILRTEDSIRKLKLLDARGKVWAQEATMQVDDKAVKMFDQTTQEELEHFPLTSIQHVQTDLNVESYAIIALLVKDEQKTLDIHLFHCPLVPPDVIASDIESALADCKDKKGRKIRPETLRRTRERVEATVIPPPPMDPPPAPPQKESVKDKIANWGNIHQNMEQLSMMNMPESTESPEVMIMKVNRDVQILNHTLDDIESFVSKLQKSAEAMRELNNRKGNKKSKGKKKMAGNGMLTLRAKLPPHTKFIEAFRKFKLAFNLLAKLRSHIQNPNAVEIVHFLFSPLEMCVRACGGYDIPRSVESPLLTRDSIDMLTNCTTTHEAELWGHLGEYWSKSRAEFPKEHYFPPYVPQFQSGWEPPTLLRSNSDLEENSSDLANTIAKQAERVKADEANRRLSDTLDMTATFKQHVEQHVNRNQMVNGNQSSAASTVAAGKVCRSMYDFVGRNKSELTVTQDELLEVMQDNKAWWKVRNKKGEEGYVPGTHMVLMSAHKSPSSSNSDGVSINNGYSSTSPVPPPPFVPPSSNAQPIYATSLKTIPIPPPPPPVPGNMKPMTPIRNQNKNTNNNVPSNGAQNTNVIAKKGTDQLQEELRSRVNTQQAKKRNFSIPKKPAASNAITLTEKSTSDDVKKWLYSRAFSKMTVESLGVLNGKQIFSLTKDDLKTVCEEEGVRVYSQLQVQKSMKKDDSGEENELDRVMKQMKEKIDKAE